MEHLCCILDSDESYAVRMSSCFNACKLLPYPMRAFTNEEAYLECAADNEVELLLIAESVYPLEDYHAKLVIILKEESVLMDGDDGSMTVDKYQASDCVISEVMNYYSANNGRSVAVAGSCRMVCIYSPNGHVGKTSLCLAMAGILSADNRVLYVSLEEFADIRPFADSGKGTLSDALYYYKSYSERNRNKALSVISHLNGFDYIMPVRNPVDLAESNVNVIGELIDFLGSAGGYDMVIVDMGGLIRHPWLLLDMADVVIVPKPFGEHRRMRQQEFEKFLLGRGMERLVDKLNIVDIPWDESAFFEGQIKSAKAGEAVYGRLVRSLGL